MAGESIIPKGRPATKKRTRGRSIPANAYNKFCSELKEGDILYNINKPNGWGEYLLVANKTCLLINDILTWTILFVGLSPEYEDNNTRINLTPENADNISFLKKIGHCKFSMVCSIGYRSINENLLKTYKNTSLWRYAGKILFRKPKRRKYGKDGNLMVRSGNS
jgi:hypothetical protein